MRSVVLFFVLTFVWSWTWWLAGPRFLILIGVFGPAIIALSLVAGTEGASPLRALLARMVQWRVAWKWYVFAVGYMAAIKLVVALVHRLGFGSWPRFGNEPWFVIVAAIPISTLSQSGEEIGWRGYALPRLATRFGFGGASILLGIIWAVWHLPLFFFPGADKNGQSFPVYALEVTALSVAFAWLYVHTKGSLLLTMLLHSAVNQTKDIVPSAVPGAKNPFALSTSPVAWITVALLWTCAGYFLVRMRGAEATAAGTAARLTRSA